MRQDGGSSDEEGDMLMALAEQAGPTPKSHSQRSSQQVYTTPLSPRKCGLLLASDLTGSNITVLSKLHAVCLPGQPLQTEDPDDTATCKPYFLANKYISIMQWPRFLPIYANSSEEITSCAAGGAAKVEAAAHEPALPLTA